MSLPYSVYNGSQNNNNINSSNNYNNSRNYGYNQQPTIGSSSIVTPNGVQIDFSSTTSSGIPLHSIVRNNPMEHMSMYGVSPVQISSYAVQQESREEEEEESIPQPQPFTFSQQPSVFQPSLIQSSNMNDQNQIRNSALLKNAQQSSHKISASVDSAITPQSRPFRYNKPLPTAPGEQLNSELAKKQQMNTSQILTAKRSANDFSNLVVTMPNNNEYMNSFPEYPELETQELKEIKQLFLFGLLFPGLHFLNLKNRNSSMPEVRRWARKSISFGIVQFAILFAAILFILSLLLLVLTLVLSVGGYLSIVAILYWFSFVSLSVTCMGISAVASCFMAVFGFCCCCCLACCSYYCIPK